MAGAKPVVTVFNSAGDEGRSIVNALAASGKYRVRAVAIEHNGTPRGVEQFKGDITKKSDVQRAVKDTYAVFAATDVFEVGTEFYKVGKMVVEASKEAEVAHFLWSTLPDVEKKSKGKWKVPFFTERAKVNKVVMDQKFKYFTFIETGFFFNSFEVGFTRPNYEDGSLVFDLPLGPDNVLPGCDPADIGQAALTALQHPTVWNAKCMTLAGYNAPMKKWMEVFNKVTKRKAVLHTLDFKKPSDMMPAEMLQMFGWIREFSYFGDHKIIDEHEAKLNLRSWEDWLRSSGWKGPSAGGHA